MDVVNKNFFIFCSGQKNLKRKDSKIAKKYNLSPQEAKITVFVMIRDMLNMSF